MSDERERPFDLVANETYRRHPQSPGPIPDPVEQPVEPPPDVPALDVVAVERGGDEMTPICRAGVGVVACVVAPLVPLIVCTSRRPDHRRQPLS